MLDVGALLYRWAACGSSYFFVCNCGEIANLYVSDCTILASLSMEFACFSKRFYISLRQFRLSKERKDIFKERL